MSGREKTEFDVMRMQRDNLLMLLRRLIVAIRRGNELSVKSITEKAEGYMARECPPPQIIRAMETENAGVDESQGERTERRPEDRGD